MLCKLKQLCLTRIILQTTDINFFPATKKVILKNFFFFSGIHFFESTMQQHESISQDVLVFLYLLREVIWFLAVSLSCIFYYFSFTLHSFVAEAAIKCTPGLGGELSCKWKFSLGLHTGYAGWKWLATGLFRVLILQVHSISRWCQGSLLKTMEPSPPYLSDCASGFFLLE